MHSVAVPDKLLRELKRIEHGAPDHRALRQRALGLLVDAVGAMAGVAATIDPATLISTSCELFGAEHEPEREATLIRDEYAPEGDVNLVPDLLRAPRLAGTLHRATGGALERSSRWRDVLSLHGVVDELRVALVARGECWGVLMLYRADRPFRDDELEPVASCSTLLADALRRSLLRALVAAGPVVDSPPGVLCLGAGSAVEALSPEGRALLERGGAELENAARGVLAASDVGHDRQALLVTSTGQRFVLHATRLDGRPAAIVEIPRPVLLAEHIVRAWGLTRREREVVSHVVAGGTTKEIARALDISEWTVQDHLKAIFDKAGVSSRRELTARLAFEHYLPRMASSSTPSPYGWFLPHGDV